MTFYSVTLARAIYLPDDGSRIETCRSFFNVLMCKFYKFYLCAVFGIKIELQILRLFPCTFLHVGANNVALLPYNFSFITSKLEDIHISMQGGRTPIPQNMVYVVFCQPCYVLLFCFRPGADIRKY